jgi:hypothetical protein
MSGPNQVPNTDSRLLHQIMNEFEAFANSPTEDDPHELAKRIEEICEMEIGFRTHGLTAKIREIQEVVGKWDPCPPHRPTLPHGLNCNRVTLQGSAAEEWIESTKYKGKGDLSGLSWMKILPWTEDHDDYMEALRE